MFRIIKLELRKTGDKMQENLKIAGLQLDLHWENPSKNLSKIFEHLNQLDEVDIIILPESFSTGFSMKALDLAYHKDSTDLMQLQKWVDDKATVICGSVWYNENGNLSNRFLWISPNNEIQYYDKRHLFSLSEEPSVMKAGNLQILINYKGWKIAPFICYDLRFPVWSKNSTEFNYDLSIYVANWPERRSFAWEQLLSARAIENQSYVIGINRMGVDGNGVDHIGASQVIQASGEIITRAENNCEQVIYANLSLEKLKNYRKKLPFLLDSDKFNLEA